MKCCIGVMSLLIATTFAYNKEYTMLKLRCYQCNQPYQCGHGVCYGDLCVKTSSESIDASIGFDFAPLRCTSLSKRSCFETFGSDSMNVVIDGVDWKGEGSDFNNAYVSKGCENITHTVSHYEPQMKLKSYCRTEVVFGIESTICYCRDDDFCNSSTPQHIAFALAIVVALHQLLRPFPNL
ncbi:unnamed protein product [Nippostrongylus brasiliensis]|uniref:Protein quiver n=1 Tax=Nippostrongylus brasiliensis TaxID=27835 RepID=A0A0N4YY70_NIPBR|nr:unnamed protein product [Nippostrongylus brasiliensis]